MRLAALMLSCLLVFSAAGPAYGVAYGEPGYIWPPSDWEASLGVWELYTDAQKAEIVRDYNLAQAIKWEQMQGKAGVGDLYRQTYGRTPAVDAAVSDVLESATIGQVASATGRTTTQVSAAVAQQTARIKATGFPAWAKKNGLALGEAIMPSLIANAALWYVGAQTAPYVHADGSECHWFGQCPGDETHYMNPELGDKMSLLWPPAEWSLEVTGAPVYTFEDNYPVPASYATQSGSVDVRVAHEWKYATPSEDAKRLAGLVAQTAYSAEGQPIVAYLQQLPTIARSFGWFNRVTGEEYGSGYSLQWVDYQDDHSVAVYSESRVEEHLGWYDAQMALLLANGDAALAPSEEVTGAVGAMGPPVPNVPFVAAVTGLDSNGSFDPDLTIGEAAEHVTIPEPTDIPAPVHDATETTPEQQEQVQPVDAPFVSGWLAEVLNPILQPVYSLFDGLDIFWPFRFMAARG